MSDCIAEAYAGVTLLKSEKAFTSWLFKILYRECCRILRMRSVKSAEESLDLSAEIPVYDSHLAPELEEALKTLQPDERDIVLLSAVAGYKTREIAEMLSLNHATVRSKLSRSLAKMKNFLE